jgi:hypothetical protein
MKRLSPQGVSNLLTPFVAGIEAIDLMRMKEMMSLLPTPSVESLARRY